ncbi:MAG TPA: hypothetical protein PLO67_14135 [Saprospiraceae bacterium]|nr:hypothetical protein [Saprospiraceae bacterium]HPI06623.1 hypothetical protein [Saprospiraceae bacterium]
MAVQFGKRLLDQVIIAGGTIIVKGGLITAAIAALPYVAGTAVIAIAADQIMKNKEKKKKKNGY